MNKGRWTFSGLALLVLLVATVDMVEARAALPDKEIVNPNNDEDGGNWMYVNGPVTISTDETYDTVSTHGVNNAAPYDKGALTINSGTTLNVSEMSDFTGSLAGGGTIQLVDKKSENLENDVSFDYRYDGDAFTGLIDASFKRLPTDPEPIFKGRVFVSVGKLRNGSVLVGKQGLFMAALPESRVKNLTLDSGALFGVMSHNSGQAAKLIVEGTATLNNNTVFLWKENSEIHDDSGQFGVGVTDLGLGKHTILEAGPDGLITGKFADTVLTEAGIGSDDNMGMPLLKATLDQTEANKVYLNIDTKTEAIPDLPVPTQDRQLYTAIASGSNLVLTSAMTTATTAQLVSFSTDMDSARGSVSAASNMAVNTAGPSSLARLDSLSVGSGGTSPMGGGFMPVSGFASMMQTGQHDTFARSNSSMGFDDAYAMSSSSTNSMGGLMAQAAGTGEGVTNGIWARPVYWFNKNDKDGSNPSSEINGFGFVTGYDVALGPVTVGLSYGYSRSKLDMTSVDGDMDDHTVGLYGSVKLPAELLFKAWVGHSWQAYDIDRNTSGLGVLSGGTLNRDSSAKTWSASALLSRDFTLTETVRLAPFAGVNAAWVKEDAYTETAKNGVDENLRLEYGGYSDTKVFSTVGADLTYEVENWGVRGRLAWNARLAGDQRAERTYRLTGVSWQESLGSRVDDNSASVGLAAWYHMPSHPEFSVFGGYDANLGDKSQTHALTAGARYEF